MGLETGDYIDDLVITNPVGATDTKSSLDDHIRLIKKVLKQTFPNLTGAVTATHTELNAAVGQTLPDIAGETGLLYTDGTTITWTDLAAAIASAAASFNTHSFVATGSEGTTITLPWNYIVGGRTLFVYVNGLLHQPSAHYTETGDIGASSDEFELAEALKAGDNVYIVGNVTTAAFVPIEVALIALGALIPAADKLPYFISGTTAALATFTSFARTFLAAADASAARTLLDVYSQDEIDALTGTGVLGVNQSWVDAKASRTVTTSYRNTTASPIMVNIEYVDGNSRIEVSDNGGTWVIAARSTSGSQAGPLSVVVPSGRYYRLIASGGSIDLWAELR